MKNFGKNGLATPSCRMSKSLGAHDPGFGARDRQCPAKAQLMIRAVRLFRRIQAVLFVARGRRFAEAAEITGLGHRIAARVCGSNALGDFSAFCASPTPDGQSGWCWTRPPATPPPGAQPWPGRWASSLFGCQSSGRNSTGWTYFGEGLRADISANYQFNSIEQHAACPELAYSRKTFGGTLFCQYLYNFT